MRLSVDVYSYTMIRKQVYITEELNEELKRLAARTGKPEAEHVRAALLRYLDDGEPIDGGSPLDRLVGLVENQQGPTDVAVNHDHYLYGAPKVRP